MQKIKVKIYVNYKKCPLCTVDVEDESFLEEFFESLENNKLIAVNDVVFRTCDFKMATIKRYGKK